jgi:pyruvate/2-oxoglutarate/acetoin dehydrogenase E1 component
LPTLSYGAAIEEAIAAEMRLDERVFHVGTLTPQGLLDEFGERRVLRTPISESAMTGLGIGAAASGWRPIINWRATTFTFVAFDQIVNQAAKIRYMFGGQASFPMVFRTFYIGGMRNAAQHSQSAYAMFAHVPGLKVLTPSNPADAFGLMRAAIRDNNPVVNFEAFRLDDSIAEVDENLILPIGVATVVREGTDVTVVAIGSMVEVATAAADLAEGAGISVEVVDPRTLVPLDLETIRQSVRHTGRLVVADESPPTCSMAAEIATVVVEDAETFRSLEGPVQRVCAAPVPVPFSPPLEDAVMPNVDDVLAAIRSAVDDD